MTIKMINKRKSDTSQNITNNYNHDSSFMDQSKSFDDVKSNNGLISGQAPSERIHTVIEKYFNKKVTDMKTKFRPEPLMSEVLIESSSSISPNQSIIVQPI
jgi:hypothetical protein